MRILSRDEELCTQVLVKQLNAIEVMIAKLIELSQVCINGSNHTNNASAQAIYNQTGTFSSPNGHAGIGPDGSGPI